MKPAFIFLASILLCKSATGRTQEISQDPVAGFFQPAAEEEPGLKNPYSVGSKAPDISLESISEDGVIAKFIERKGEGLHHIAFEVADIKAEMKRLQAEGFILLNEEPKKGADNKLVCFLHPKGTNGVLVELCQSV